MGENSISKIWDNQPWWLLPLMALSGLVFVAHYAITEIPDQVGQSYKEKLQIIERLGICGDYHIPEYGELIEYRQEYVVLTEVCRGANQ